MTRAFRQKTQTAGGLLLSVARADAAALLDALPSAGASAVGNWRSGSGREAVYTSGVGAKVDVVSQFTKIVLAFAEIGE